MPERVVFDTNVMIAALLGFGAARRCLSLARNKEIQAVYCSEMLAELAEKLQYKFKFTVDDLRTVVYLLRNSAEEIAISGTLQIVASDPDDDKFIECALIGGCSIILSSDHHLLELGKYQKIEIITPRVFLFRRTTGVVR